MKNLFIAFVVAVLMFIVHVETFAHNSNVNVTIRPNGVAAAPYLYIPAAFFWDREPIKDRREAELWEKRIEAKAQKEADERKKERLFRKLEATKKKP